MSFTTDICTLAFAGLALLSSGQAIAQPAATPTRAFPQIMVDSANNSYYTTIGIIDAGTTRTIREYVSCTSGLVTTIAYAHSNSSAGTSLSTKAVVELSSSVQQHIRTNCSNNGLRAGF
jgi:hypothetical protein